MNLNCVHVPQVGSFLFTCLRHWLEEHQVLFPLDRPSLLMLEAELLIGSNSEAASSLLIAASMSQGAAEDIRWAERYQNISASTQLL